MTIYYVDKVGRPLACGAILAALAVGCQSPTGPLARWGIARDRSIAKGLTKEEMGDSRGLMSRWLAPRAGPSKDPTAAKGGLVNGSDGYNPMQPAKNPEADAELAAAEKLFQQGDLAGAEAAYQAAAKKRKETPWGETAQYFLAEARFQRGNYVGAHDAFEVLISTYPGTRYLEKAVAREYTIAQDWLAWAESNPEAEAKDKDKPKDAPPTQRTWTDHFTGRLPTIDVAGHALRALEHVRHHDPTGPLADDAVLKIADYHMARGNYEDASTYYDQLITDHPKSPFYAKAQLASIDAKMKGYLGPEYDGAGLGKAREQIKMAAATTTERRAGTDDKLYNSLALIEDQDAARAYNDARSWQRMGHVTSAEFYYGEVLQRWPKSEWAKKAKVEMAALAKAPRKKALPSKILTTPGSPDPYAGGLGSASSSVGGSPMGGGGIGAPTGP